MLRWRARDFLAACVLTAALGAACGFSIWTWREARANGMVAALAAGRDEAVTHGDPARVQAALGLFWIGKRRLEEAQGVAERMEGQDGAARAVLLYGLGNAHMRRALAIFANAPIRDVAPLINQAKAEYRISLRLDPGNWDARYNYDIAASLVRDQDPPPSRKGEEMARDRALIPDLPGVPNGLP